MAFYQKIWKQELKSDLETMWDFISSPQNLKKITPDYMGFDITGNYMPDKMYQGMMISYKVSPLLGISMDWLTEISHIEPMSYFVDEQRVGPYKLWHHQHKIEKTERGVLMTDILTYQISFSILGQVANTLFIDKKIEEIFDYRKKVLNSVFGEV